MSAFALSLRNVGKSYGSGERRVTALKRASLDIKKGELLGVIGPSGSGKTTFLMLAGLVEPPSTGEVWFQGHKAVDSKTTVKTLRKVRQRHIGFVFQKANLLPFLTATENVRVAMEVAGHRGVSTERRAAELLDQLGLSHRLDAFPRTLSGGEQQRVAMARAIANRPSLLLADEPTAALDGERRLQVMNLLSDLARKEGVTVCIVTHDTRSNALFDRIIEISDGEISSQQTSYF